MKQSPIFSIISHYIHNFIYIIYSADLYFDKIFLTFSYVYACVWCDNFETNNLTVLLSCHLIEESMMMWWWPIFLLHSRLEFTAQNVSIEGPQINFQHRHLVVVFEPIIIIDQRFSFGSHFFTFTIIIELQFFSWFFPVNLKLSKVGKKKT